ncbi:hypothetical protein [Nocardia jejuensis]|uniref:hypothetical protein n=1 Tax=Nocardia jejuensis TaxID=328049 RepID=UPI0012F7DEC9|nr:hypothetical protein [Nocardia jejuensis]
MIATSAHASTPEEARVAGCDFATAIATYDYRDIDTHLAGILDRTTGEFRQMFQDNQSALRAALVAAQAHSEAGNVQCTLISGDSEHARVALEFDTIANTKSGPRSDHVSTVDELDNVNGRWLISRADPSS